MIKCGYWGTQRNQRVIREAEFIGRNPYNGYYGVKLPDGLVMWLEKSRIAWIDSIDKETNQLELYLDRVKE